MYGNKVCPLIGKNTEVLGEHYWECREQACRFQINGRCAILAGFDLSLRNNEYLEKICKAVGIRI